MSVENHFRRTSELGGEAQRFLDALRGAREAGYPHDGWLVKIQWGHESIPGAAPGVTVGWADGTDDEAELHNMFASAVIAYFDPPNDAVLEAHLAGTLADAGFDVGVQYVEPEDRVVVRFDDGSVLESTGEGEAVEDRWEAAVVSGLLQVRLEEIIALATEAALVQQVEQDEQRVAEAVLALLSSLATSERPNRGLVAAGLSWLAQKADVFAEHAARAAGSATGVAAAAAGGPFVTGHGPELLRRVQEVLALAAS